MKPKEPGFEEERHSEQGHGCGPKSDPPCGPEAFKRHRHERMHGHGPMHGPGTRIFERGGLKFAILAHLKDKPSHGYDIIRDMEEQSGGFYSPSPGAIYPTLQALEDQDLVTSATEEGKKVYTVTEAGIAYLEEHKERAASHRERWEAHWGHGPQGENWGIISDIRDTVGDVMRAVRQSVGDTDKLKEVGAVLEEAAGKIRDILKR